MEEMARAIDQIRGAPLTAISSEENIKLKWFLYVLKIIKAN